MRRSLRSVAGTWVGLLALAMCVASAGCGSSPGKIVGKVYYKDAPLKGGNVTFVCADGQSRLAEIQEDGSYAVDKVAPGEVKISVDTSSLKPQGNIPRYQPPKGVENKSGFTPPDFAAQAKRYVAIPKQYADAEHSGLKYTVKRGSQQYDIHLQ